MNRFAVLMFVGAAAIFSLFYFYYRFVLSFIAVYFIYLVITALLLSVAFYIYKKAKTKAQEIINNAKSEANTIITDTKKILTEQQNDIKKMEQQLVKKEQEIENKISIYKKRLIECEHSLSEKNKLISKIKQVAYAQGRNDKSAIEEIRRRLYDI
jgi:predicted PurR-regulated permease PerM